MRCFLMVGLLTMALASAGCAKKEQLTPADERNGALTSGAVSMTVTKGATDQTAILEAFGPPDIQTHRDGLDVWTYEKTDYEYEQRRDYFNVLIYGVGGVKGRSSSQSTMLILYFNDKGVVQDYRLSVVRY